MYQTETGCSWMLRAPFSTACTTGMTTIQIPTSSPRENACAKLSTACKKYGKDLDIMIADEPDVELVAKDIIVRATLRAVDTIADSSPATSQASQSAMGYSVSMTYLNAGQQLYFLRNELKELGVMRQRYGAMEVYDV